MKGSGLLRDEMVLTLTASTSACCTSVQLYSRSDNKTAATRPGLAMMRAKMMERRISAMEIKDRREETEAIDLGSP